MFCLFIKENVDYLLRLRFIWYRQTPCHLQRVKAHAVWRELQLQFLMTFEILPISMKQESKVDVHPICPCISISAHRHLQFLEFNFSYYIGKDTN